MNRCHGPDVHVVQVDERVAPTGDPERNLTHLHESLLAPSPLDARQVHAMPVESPDLEAASERYARKLREIAGSPAALDIGRSRAQGGRSGSASVRKEDPFRARCELHRTTGSDPVQPHL